MTEPAITVGCVFYRISVIGVVSALVIFGALSIWYNSYVRGATSGMSFGARFHWGPDDTAKRRKAIVSRVSCEI